MATSPTGMSNRNENLGGLTSMTTAVSVNIAAEAPTNVVSAGKKGRLSRKLKIPPVKNAESIRPDPETPSRVLPNT